MQNAWIGWAETVLAKAKTKDLKGIYDALAASDYVKTWKLWSYYEKFYAELQTKDFTKLDENLA
jgi:vacuolar-type H+-ATPase subunit C/Vma6